jgi:hypothetical protein
MKIDVTQDALLRALVEAIRDERDQGGALMRLMSRLVNEATKQGWFETHLANRGPPEARSAGLRRRTQRLAVSRAGAGRDRRGGPLGTQGGTGRQ